MVGIKFGGREILPPSPGHKSITLETERGRIGRIRESRPLIGPSKPKEEEHAPLLSWKEYAEYKFITEKKTPTPKEYTEYVKHYKYRYTPGEMSPEERILYVKAYGVFEGEKKGSTYTWSELKKREPAAELRVGSGGDIEVYLDIESWHKREYETEKNPVKKYLRASSAFTIWGAFNPVYYYRLAQGDVGGAREILSRGEYSAQKKLMSGDITSYYLKDVLVSPGFTYVVYPLAAGVAIGGVSGAILGRTAAAAAGGGTSAVASHAFARGIIYTGQAALMGAGVIQAAGVIQKAGSPGSPYRDPGEAAAGLGTQIVLGIAGYRAGYKAGSKYMTSRYAAGHPEQIKIIKVRSGELRGEYISRAESPQKFGVPSRGGTEWSKDLILKRELIYQPAPKKILIRPLPGHGAEYMGRASILGGGLRVIRNPRAFSYVSESMVKSGITKVLGYGVSETGPGSIKIGPGTSAYAPGVVSMRSGLFMRGIFRSGGLFKRASVKEMVNIGESEFTPPVLYSGGLYKSTVIPRGVASSIMGPPPSVFFSVPGGAGLGFMGGFGIPRVTPYRAETISTGIRTPIVDSFRDAGMVKRSKSKDIVFPIESMDMGFIPASIQGYKGEEVMRQRTGEVSVPLPVPGIPTQRFLFRPIPGGIPFGFGFGRMGAREEGSLRGILERRRQYRVGWITEAIGI